MTLWAAAKSQADLTDPAEAAQGEEPSQGDVEGTQAAAQMAEEEAPAEAIAKVCKSQGEQSRVTSSLVQDTPGESLGPPREPPSAKAWLAAGGGN